MINLYHEIFQKLSDLNTKEEKISWLRANATVRFKDFLIGTFNPNIKFDVEIPTYRPASEPAGLNYNSLHNAMSKIYLFVENHPRRPATLTQEKKMAILKTILESVHKEEALLFIDFLNKRVKVKSLTPKLVKEAFPDMDLE